MKKEIAVTIDFILNNINDVFKFAGNADYQVSNPTRLESIFLESDRSSSIIFINEKVKIDELELQKLKDLKVGLIITTENIYETIKNDQSNYILANDPRRIFNKVLNLLFTDKLPSKIENSAVISSSSKIGSDCYIGHGVIIEENVEIGNNSEILHNTVLRANTKIGNNVKIGCNNTIGSAGFGYVKNDEGVFEKVLHIGNVVIEDDVVIHGNTCIDKAVLGSTIIRKGAKIDNLVHISHGVEIGENSLVIANSMIGGSSKIGKSSWIAPSVSIINKVQIGDNNLIGMGAIVTKNTPDNFKGFGNPIEELQTQKKWLKIRANLLNKDES